VVDHGMPQAHSSDGKAENNRPRTARIVATNPPNIRDLTPQSLRTQGKDRAINTAFAGYELPAVPANVTASAVS
jgi:hypothetical protein